MTLIDQPVACWSVLSSRCSVFQGGSTETQNTSTRDTDTASRFVAGGREPSVLCCEVNRVPPVQVNPELKSHFEDQGFRFVGQDVEGERMEVIELDGRKS